MRKFAEARRTLSQLQASPSVREDPHFQVSVLTLRAKLALARQEPVEALATLEELRYIDAPKRALGEHLGIMAIAQAITENLDAANATAAEALDLVSSVEAIFYSRYASFVAHLRSANSREAPPRADDLAQLIAETVEAEFLDGLVVAYRAEPTILKLMASSAVARQTTHLVLKLAHDETFARSLGIEVPRAAAASRVQDLTPREAEVLELMCEGLSNRTIAARLFISESTAKVHVHHILVKLGVETRLQAVVRATEAANIELS